MIGTCRVRAAPRSSSASSKPSISGIWTSMMARATSCCRTSSSASTPERAVSTSTPSRRSSAESASRFSSRSSTSRHLTRRRGDEHGSTTGAITRPPHVERAQQIGDLRQRQHAIRRRPLERGFRHHRRHRGLGLLDDRNSAGTFHRLETGGAVGVAAGEDHTEQATPEHVGGRFEQDIDRRPGEVDQFVDREHDLRSRVDQQVVVGRSEVDAAGLDRLPCPAPRAPSPRTCG